MSSLPPNQYYTGIVAELYRHLRSETFDATPYARLIDRYGQPALELGCGDGDPMLDLVERGYAVEGLDASADMLRRCRLHAAERGLDVVLHESTFEAMDLGRRYRSIYFAGATMNLVPTDEAAESTLHRIAAHLEPGGAALITLFIPAPPDAGSIGATREQRDVDGSVMRVTTLDQVRDEDARTQVTTLRYERLVDDAVVDHGARRWLIHWYTQDAFAAMVERAGLRVIRVFEPSADEFTMLVSHAN